MKVLKWVILLPSAIIAMFAVNFLYRLVAFATSSRFTDPDSLLHLIYVEGVSGFLSSAAFIYVGALVAPRYKKETGFVLTILLAMIIGGSFFAANVITKEYFSNIGIIGSIVGVGYAYFQIRNEDLEVL